jgi:hypothetical protein
VSKSPVPRALPPWEDVMSSGMICSTHLATVFGALLALSGSSPALACQSFDGCMNRFMNENNVMMSDGRHDAMMRAGKASIDSFEAMRAAGQSHTALSSRRR